MRLLEKRPLATWCFTFVLLSFLLFFCVTDFKWLLGVLLLAALVLCAILLRRYLRILFCGILLACLLAVVTSLLTYDLGYRDLLDRHTGERVQVQGEVTEIGWTEDGRSTYTVKLSAINGEAVSVHARLTAPEDAFAKYDLFSATASLQSSIAVSGTFSQRWYLLSQDVLFVGNTHTITSIQSQANTIAGCFDTLSLAIGEVLEEQIGGDAANLARGILLGERDTLSAVITRDFRRCGVSHLLAVSGLHLSILLGLLTYACTILFPTRLSRFPLLLFFVAFFVLLVGTRASILRASGMAILAACASLVGRRSDPLTNLSVSAALILLCSPTAILDLGYLLSCLATFGILALGLPLLSEIQSKLHQRLPAHTFLRRVLLIPLSSLLLTLSATVFTLPICVLCFDSFALLTPLANLVLVPLATFLLALTIPALLCGFLSQNVTFLADVVRNVADLMLSITAWGSRHTEITLPYTIPLLSLLICIGVFLLLLALLCTRRLRMTALALCLLLVLGAMPVANIRFATKDATTVSYLPSVKADLLLITNGADATLIIGGHCTDEVLEEAFSFVRQHAYVDEISTLVLCTPTSTSLTRLSRSLGQMYIRDILLLTPLSVSSSVARRFSTAGTQLHIAAEGDTTHPLQNGTLYISNDQELVLSAYGHSLYYQRTATLRSSPFYYKHADALSGILISGMVEAASSHSYTIPLIGHSGSLSLPKTSDIVCNSEAGASIRISKKGFLPTA